MKKLFPIILLLFPLQLLANELQIKYELNPQIRINSHDYMTLVIAPDGHAVWIGELPNPIRNNAYDWEAFHRESRNRIHEMQYSKEQYTKILDLVLALISDTVPNNKEIGGKGYAYYNISLWGNPNIEFRFTIGGKDFPEGINKLNDYIKSLPPPNKKMQPTTKATTD